MALLLVQHAQSLTKEEDPEKGLSMEGRKTAERMAALAREHGVAVAVIQHSGKKRARQTAEIFADALSPARGVQAAAGLNPLDDVTAFNMDSAAGQMLVGHLPFMERLAAHLVAGAAEKAPVVKLQNAGIVCLEKDAALDHWYVKWMLMPPAAFLSGKK